MPESGNERGDGPSEGRDNQPDEIPDEKPEQESFNPNDDSPDDTPDEGLFNPNDDISDEKSDEESFNPNDESPDESPDEELFNPNDDVTDEKSDDEPFNPNDDSLDETPDKKIFNPYDNVPDEKLDENYNPGGSGTITVTEQEHENEPETEPEKETEEIAEKELEHVSPEGEPMGSVESRETIDVRADLESWGYEPEYDPEIESEVEDQTAESETESEQENEPESELEGESKQSLESENESENESDTQPEEFELITPEGEPISHPEQVPRDLIPIEETIDKLYEQQQSAEEELESENEPYNMPEQEPEIISEEEPESDSERGSEVIPEQKSDLILEQEQEPELIPKQKSEQKQKSKRIKAKKLELITDSKDLDDYKHYEHQHIVKTKYDVIFREKQFKKSEQKAKPQKKKPKKVKKLELITGSKENTKREDTKIEKKQIEKIPEKSESKSEKSSEKVLNAKPKEIKNLELITEPIKKEKPEEKNDPKLESQKINKEKSNKIEIAHSESQKQSQSTENSNKQSKVGTVSKKRLDLREKYRLETGKRPIYNKKETKGFLSWLEKQKKLEDWQKLLEKWIWEANEAKISKQIKKELIDIIKKYNTYREIHFKLVKLLERDNLTKEETEELKILVNKLEKMTHIQAELFKILNTFQSMYNHYHIGYKLRIIQERDKFVKFLADKLNWLKRLNKNNNNIEEPAIISLINAWFELQIFFRGGGGSNDYKKIEKWKKYRLSEGFLRGASFDDEFRKINKFFYRDNHGYRELDYVLISDGQNTIKIYRKDKVNLRRYMKLVEKLRIRKLQIESLGHGFTSIELSRKVNDYDLARYLTNNIKKYRGMKLKDALNEFKKEIAKNNHEFTQGNVICEVCGSNKKVYVHHIYPRIWVFFFLGISMHRKDNLKLICETCHHKIWHAATDILDNTTPMEPKYSKSNDASKKEISDLLTLIKNENAEKIQRLRILIEKYMIKKSNKSREQINERIEYWLNRFLQLWIGPKELLQQYNALKKNVKNEIESVKILEAYYDSKVKIDQFDAIETYEKFLTYFKMKDEHFGTSYKNEFLQVANKLLNKVKKEQNNWLRKYSKKEKEYSTLDLINDLRRELQKFPELLFKLFPKRASRYTDTMLSILWRGETSRNEYIKNIKRNFKSKKIKFSMKSLELLEKILESRYNKRREFFVNLIRSYKEGKINTLKFIDQLKIELGKISDKIPVTDEELSLLFGMSSTYIKNKLIILTSIYAPNYNPYYLFSLENLNDFLNNLQVLLGEKSKKLREYIEKYIYLNPSIKQYSLQQYIIKNPDYFSQNKLLLLEPVRFYWLGFLYADGYIEEETHKIQFKLSKSDEDRLKKFANHIGYPIEKIQEILEINEVKGEIKIFPALRVWFGCKPMAKHLKELGFIGFKSGIEGIPEIIKTLILKAKQISTKNKTHWYETAEGRCALAFLLGFYDGDGSYRGGMSAVIYNTNKKFLEEVKIFYRIENEIRVSRKKTKDNKQSYYLSLGPINFRTMLESFKDSMIRKRNSKI